MWGRVVESCLSEGAIATVSCGAAEGSGHESGVAEMDVMRRDTAGQRGREGVGEGKGEGGREGGRGYDTKTETRTNRDRLGDRATRNSETVTLTDRDRGALRHDGTETQKHGDTATQTQRHRCTQRHRDTDEGITSCSSGIARNAFSIW